MLFLLFLRNNLAKGLKAVWLKVWKPQVITSFPLEFILIFLWGLDNTHSSNKL